MESHPILCARRAAIFLTYLDLRPSNHFYFGVRLRIDAALPASLTDLRLSEFVPPTVHWAWLPNLTHLQLHQLDISNADFPPSLRRVSFGETVDCQELAYVDGPVEVYMTTIRVGPTARHLTSQTSGGNSTELSFSRVALRWLVTAALNSVSPIASNRIYIYLQYNRWTRRVSPENGARCTRPALLILPV